MSELKKIYERRFGANKEFRKKMYEVLCKDFFSKYISEDSTVLDVAAGYCVFINSVKAKRKIAVDLNPDIEKFADNDVEVIKTSSINLEKINNNMIDVAYIGNFLEHLTKQDIVKTVEETNRVLKKGGRVLILQPNFRYCYKDYWMFFDHITPLDDRSLCEILELKGFEIIENIPKFLPFSLSSRFPQSLLLLKIYLRLPVAQIIFGQQAFICAQKV